MTYDNGVYLFHLIEARVVLVALLVPRAAPPRLSIDRMCPGSRGPRDMMNAAMDDDVAAAAVAASA